MLILFTHSNTTCIDMPNMMIVSEDDNPQALFSFLGRPIELFLIPASAP